MSFREGKAVGAVLRTFGRRRSPRYVAVPAAALAPGVRGSARPRPGRVGRTAGALVRVLVAIGAFLASMIGVAFAIQPAQAGPLDGVSCSLDGGTANIGPELAGGGATYWIPFVATEDSAVNKRGVQQHPSQHTLWEVVGPRGLTWSYTPWALKEPDDVNWDGAPDKNFEERCSPVDAASGNLAQLMWEPSRFLGGLTIALKQLATNEAPFKSVYEGNQKLLSNMKTYFAIPALTIAVILAGYWVAIRISRRADARETYSGVITSGLIVIGIAAVLAGSNYTTITGAIDKYTASFNSGMMELVSVNGTDNVNSPCYLPQASATQPGEGGDPDLGYNLGKRSSTCLLYEVLLYQPWVNGQYGSDQQLLVNDLKFPSNTNTSAQFDYCHQAEEPTTKVPTFEYRCLPQSRTFPDSDTQAKINLAVQQIVAQSITRNEFLRKNAVTEDHQNHWLAVHYTVGRNFPGLHEVWRGSEPSGRMATAVSALVVNLIAMFFIGLLAILTIFWHGVFLVAWVFLPLVGAVAAYPPARRIVKTVLGVMVQAIFLRCVFGLVLAVLLAVLNVIQSAPGALPLKILLMLIATAAIWKLLTALRSGALAPQISQEALQAGAMPSDSGSTRVVVGTVTTTRAAAGGIIARGRGAAAGARAGRRVGEATAADMGYARGSDEWKQTVGRSRRQGAAAGYRSTTSRGQQSQHAENQAERTTRPPAEAQARQKYRVEETKRRQQKDQSDERRHEETLEELRRKRQTGS
ncbi:hypothetical protein [Flindersiella endophytica]